MILVDSNAWIYFLDEALPEHAKARRKLGALLESEDVLLPTVVQMEVIHYVVARLGAESSRVVGDFLAFPGDIEPLSGAVVVDASRILLAHRDAGIGGRDATLLSIAQRREAVLVTADKPLAKVAQKMGIRTASPT